MTTITIDQDIKLKKTHFANSLEAIHFLSAFQIGNQAVVVKSRKSKLEKIMEEYKKGVDILDQNDLKLLLQKRGIIR